MRDGEFRRLLISTRPLWVTRIVLPALIAVAILTAPPSIAPFLYSLY